MLTPLEGELTRHQNQPFYAQQSRPKFFWAGCLGPLIVIVIVGGLVVKGALSSAGLELIRIVVLSVLALSIVQFLGGGGLFLRQRSSLGKGLMIGAVIMILSVVFIFIALASLIGSALK